MNGCGNLGGGGGGAENKMGNLGLWIVPRSHDHIILCLQMISSQCWLISGVEILGAGPGGGGGVESTYF